MPFAPRFGTACRVGVHRRFHGRRNPFAASAIVPHFLPISSISRQDFDNVFSVDPAVVSDDQVEVVILVGVCIVKKTLLAAALALTGLPGTVDAAVVGTGDYATFYAGTNVRECHDL